MLCFLTLHAFWKNDVDARTVFHGDILHTLHGKDVGKECTAHVLRFPIADPQLPENSFAGMLHLAARVVVLQQGKQVAPLGPHDATAF